MPLVRRRANVIDATTSPFGRLVFRCMGRLWFWAIVAVFSGFMLVVSGVSEWQRLNAPPDAVASEFRLFYVLLEVALLYVFARAALTVIAELRRHRSGTSSNR